MEKVYLNRHAEIGDTVEAVSNPFNVGDHIVGYEYTVKRLGHGYVVVTSNRLPKHNNEIVISDDHYQVIEYKVVPEPKETHIKTYKFLGIPFGKRTTYIYD
ncbi:hypothetical protein [Bacillus sp. UMB0728]|uniref:hypothetical protein n=1 Tax=Bacillus sp. UMB0728 TaxID=2066052 RepID=UPI000C77A8A6|nr:hypothetical protein [Bacillus sp. UMB0728]PLR72242.1 hypothetical protein CYJ37_11850 [Bacillus sp. UMB0728]